MESCVAALLTGSQAEGAPGGAGIGALGGDRAEDRAAHAEAPARFGGTAA